ncbi:MAG: ribosome small subunit-dependent GTPase A, partial [Anaerolineae bacterium]|nr:ribosome small subunit-dependent GTPase A [Anaerolineae bacterium]
MSNSGKHGRGFERKIANYQKSVGKSSQKKKNQMARKKLENRDEVKKPRQKNWMRLSDDWEDVEYEEAERIIPRGREEKRRQVEKLAAEMPLRKVGEDTALPEGEQGVVQDVYSGGCSVRIEAGGEVMRCSLRGSVLQQETGFSNAVAVGDKVLVSQEDGEQGVVEAVLPRKGVLARSDGHNRHQRQLLAANVDQVVITASWREPHFWPELVDRYLAAASIMEVQAVLCINKVDLVESRDELEAVLEVYRRVGLPVLKTSAVSGEGIEALREALKGKTSVVTGLSGAGKSTLLNAVQPGLELKTGVVGERGANINQGRHTTTQSSYHVLGMGGAVVDTPGIREFGLVGLRRADLANHYPEMAALAGECKYSDCVHLEEDGCAVKQAVQ